MAKVNRREFDNLLKDLKDFPEAVMKESGEFFKDITPIRSGNARRNTRTDRKTIKASYGYAGALDDGKSRQAPDGMTQPTIDEMARIINEKLRRL